MKNQHHTIFAILFHPDVFGFGLSDSFAPGHVVVLQYYQNICREFFWSQHFVMAVLLAAVEEKIIISFIQSIRHRNFEMIQSLASRKSREKNVSHIL